MNRQSLLSLLRSPGLLGRISLVLASMCALYLASIALGQTPLAGCDADSACFHVLGSRWAFLFGIPASFLAIAAYLVTVLAAGAFEAREHRTWLGLLGEICVIMVTVASVWFLAVQLLALKQFCFWCCLTHLLALGGVLGLTLQRRNHQQPDETRPDWAEGTLLRKHHMMSLTRIGAVTAGMVALGVGPFVAVREPVALIVQTDAPPPATATLDGSGTPSAVLSFDKGKVTFRAHELPLIGAPTAKQFAAVLTDYTCEYCRQYAVVLEELVKARGPEFAIVVLPSARDDNGRLVQHTMLCLFKANPEQHAVLNQQLLAGTVPTNAEAVRLSAQTLLGKEAWLAAEQQHSTWATKQILATQELHEANQAFTKSTRLPQLLAANQILVGFYEEVDRLNTFVESSFHPAPGAAQTVTVQHTIPAPPPIPAPEPPARPQLVTRNSFQDLGVFKPGQVRLCEVEFTNQETTPVKIAWVGLDAGCELVKMPRETIQQGATAKISVNVQAPEERERDLFLRRINIHTDAADPIVLQIQGRVATPAAAKAIGAPKTARNR